MAATTVTRANEESVPVTDSDIVIASDRTARWPTSSAPALGEIGGEEAEVLERRGIDAGAAQWVVVAGMSLGGLRQLADFILQYRKLDKVARICVGGTSRSTTPRQTSSNGSSPRSWLRRLTRLPSPSHGWCGRRWTPSVRRVSPWRLYDRRLNTPMNLVLTEAEQQLERSIRGGVGGRR